MSCVLKALVVACWLVVSVKTFYLHINKRSSERVNRSSESVKQTVIIYNDYVPVEDRLECVPLGNVVLMLRCNGVPQLPDGSDEMNCSTQDERRPGSFKCKNGKEIWDLWRCDGHYHCEDGSDETNCHDYGFRPAEDLFYLCNGVVECRGGWDEVNCPPNYTPDASQIPPSFTCSDEENSPKLTVRFKCDEQKDCEDGSDEKNCEKKFRCKNKGKTVLPADVYCEGLTFCKSEQEKPSCILVNGPSNHTLKNVSESVRSTFNNSNIEIYEYVINEGSSSEETDSFTIPHVDHTNPQTQQTNPYLQYTNPPQQSTNSLHQQFRTESTNLINYQLQDKTNLQPNDTDPSLEYSTAFSEQTPIEKMTSPEYPPLHEHNANDNYRNNDNNDSDEDRSGNNDDEEEDRSNNNNDEEEDRSGNNIDVDEDRSGNNNDDDTGNKENRNGINIDDKNATAIPINRSDKYNNSDENEDGNRNNNYNNVNRNNSDDDDDDDGGNSNNGDDEDDHLVEGSGNNNKYNSVSFNDNEDKDSLATGPYLNKFCVITSLILFLTT